MITTFFVDLWRLIVATIHGVKRDEEFRALFILLITLLTSSTLFYWKAEGWSFIDALYFSVMTMSTVGFGDLVPTTTYSKLFTIVYSILSIGVFVAVVGKLVQVMLADDKERKKKRSKK